MKNNNNNNNNNNNDNLFRAMIPLVPNTIPSLSDKQVLLSAVLNDPIVLKVQTENLYDLFSQTGTNVTLKWQHSSHNLIKDDIYYAREGLIQDSCNS